MGSDSSKQEEGRSDGNILSGLKISANLPETVQKSVIGIVQHLQTSNISNITSFFETKLACLPKESHRNRAVCQKVGKKGEEYYQCGTCGFVKGKVVCFDCFQEEKHSMHDYKSVDGEGRSCDCGNAQVLEKGGFCTDHQRTEWHPTQEEQHLETEVRLWLELMRSLVLIPEKISLSAEGHQSYNDNLLSFLSKAASVNRTYSRVTARALSSNQHIISPQSLPPQIRYLSLLESLARIYIDNETAFTNLMKLIKAVYWEQSISSITLNIFFDFLLKRQCNFRQTKMLQIFGTDYFVCRNSLKDYFSKEENYQFHISRFIPPAFAEQGYKEFYSVVSSWFQLSNPAQITEKVFAYTDFAKFFNLSLYIDLQEQIVLDFPKATADCSVLSWKIINSIEDKALLYQIGQKVLGSFDTENENVFDLIFLRTFCAALLKYCENTVSPILRQKIVKPDLMIRCLLKFLRIKAEDSKSYNQTIVSEDLPEHSLLALDLLIFSTAASIIVEHSQVAAFYQTFLSSRILKHSSIEELSSVLKGKASVALEFTKSSFKEINLLLDNIFDSALSYTTELIAASSNESNLKQIDGFLSYLGLLYEGFSPKEFEEIAAKFVSSEEVIRFIKEKIVIQNKKIHIKYVVTNDIIISPFSKFFEGKIPQTVTERITNLIFQVPYFNPTIAGLLDKQNSQHFILFLQEFVSFIQQHVDSETDLQHQLHKLIEHLLIWHVVDRSSEKISDLIERVGRKIHKKTSVVQQILKKIDKLEKNEVVDNSKALKKKQKLDGLKNKQKQMLEVYQIEDEKRLVECIVCKNSKDGNPYLLGNFSYKNIFSKILEPQTPFLEFSSCGHYIHEDCLNQSHKGDFRIWYPCILCKSICNILLPNLSSTQTSAFKSTEQQKLQRSITFLKNFGGIYTFFYQDRAELIEFKLQTVQQVFPLLFKTLAYEITFYPILNFQFFLRGQLSVTKFLYDILRFASNKLPGITINKRVQLKGEPLFVSVYNYVCKKLCISIGIQNKQGKIDEEIPEDISTIIYEIIELLESDKDILDLQPTKIPEGYQSVFTRGFYKLPHDLKELQCGIYNCASCKEAGSTFEICLLCGWGCCSKCSDTKKVHSLEVHLSESVFLSSSNGKFIYVHEDLQGKFNSLYVNYLGQEYDESNKKVAEKEYTLSEQKWENLISDILNNRLHREVMKFQ